MKTTDILCFAMLIPLASCSNGGDDEPFFHWTFWVMVAVFSLIGLMQAVIYRRNKKYHAGRMEEMRRVARSEFNVAEEVEGFNSDFLLLTDVFAGELIIMRTPENFRRIPYADITGVDILEDAEVVHSRSISRTVGGAVLGNIVAGRTGMLIGGIVGASHQTRKKKVASLTVQVHHGYPVEVTETLRCYDAYEEMTTNEVNDGDPVYLKGVAAAERIVAIIHDIIDTNNANILP